MRLSNMPVIDVRNLSKRYGPVQAVRGISVQVQSGELFGFIGPDGAGKTSLLRMLVSLLVPDGGSATVAGLDVVRDYRELRPLLGYMPGRFSLYQDLSIEENLRFFATIFNTDIAENYELIRDIYVQIEPFKHRKAGKLSGGMKQKLALCCALIHKPEVLFLDEPTTGVDAVSRKEFWEMLRTLQQFGITIVVSTPYMDEAALCDRMAFMQAGNLLKVDTPQGMIAEYPYRLLAVRTAYAFRAIKALRAYEHAHSVFGFGDEIHYTDRRNAFAAEEIQAHLHKQGISDAHCAFRTANIEDCFMAEMEETRNA